MDEILFYGGIVVAISFALVGALLFVWLDIPATFQYLRRFSNRQSRASFSGSDCRLSERLPRPDETGDDVTLILKDRN